MGGGIAVVAIIAVVSLIVFGGGNGEEVRGLSVRGAGTLIAKETQYDFGRISMAAGKVAKEFKIKNTGSGAVTATRLTTSCMCTTAELAYQGRSVGPFGMPGHGFVPGIKTVIAPGDEAIIKVVFDPAAHGPAGVGAIRREVYLEQEGGSRLTLSFSAFVTP